MQTKELRKKLHHLLDIADDKVIEAKLKHISAKKNANSGKVRELTIDDVFEVLEDAINAPTLDVVGFTAEGKLITKEEYILSVKEAELELERGEYIDLDDLKRESENW